MININALTYTLYAFASGHTQSQHQHVLLAEKSAIKHTHTHSLTHLYVLCDSLQLWKQALPEGFGLIDILPHCPGLLQGTSLCRAADKAHSITAADLK